MRGNLSKRLIIDVQVFQTPAWDRGMGKFTMELISALYSSKAAGATWQSVEIILSSKKKLPERAAKELDSRLPGIKKTYLDLEIDVDVSKYERAREHNRQTIDKYLQEEYPLDHIDFLVASIFQREIVSVFPCKGENINKILLSYDLIPLIFRQIYLATEESRQSYLPRISEMLKADLHITDSKTTANDLAWHLCIDKTRIRAIAAGPIGHGLTSRKISVPNPFILMPTGNDIRKNNLNAILGFNEFNNRNDNKYHLVITSFFQQHEVEQLGKYSTKLVFVGNVTGEELNYLYKEAEALLFPPYYEGLGLPILEAVDSDKAVACSDIPVFREISGDKFEFFEPDSHIEIAEALNKAVHKKSTDLKYGQIKEKFTWQNAVADTVDAITQKIPEKTQTREGLAIYAPTPCRNEKIGYMVQGLYSELSQRASKISLVADEDCQFMESGWYMPYLEGVSISGQGGEGSEANIYNLSNDSASAQTLVAALGKPGIAILHDADLTKVWEECTRLGLIDPSRLDLEKTIEGKIKNKGLITSLVANQRALIVHSKAAYAELEEATRNLNKKLPTYLLAYPDKDVVYPDILKQKGKKPSGQFKPEIFIEYETPSGQSYAHYAEKLTTIVSSQFSTGSN